MQDYVVRFSKVVDFLCLVKKTALNITPPVLHLFRGSVGLPGHKPDDETAVEFCVG
jgi:hypothetical protein